MTNIRYFCARFLRPVLALGAAFLVLSACDGADGFISGLSEVKAPRTTELAAGQITVAGPEGFCINKSSRLETRAGGFVALGACAAVSGDENSPMPPVPALLTVSVSKLEGIATARLSHLEAHFKTEAGLAAFSQSGQADNAEILSQNSTGGALLLQARDSSEGRPAALSDIYWRAMFTHDGGYLVSLSVNAFSGHPINDRTGHALLHAFVEEMKNANSGAETSN